MKVAVIGSRSGGISLKEMISYIPKGCTTIVSGGAKGIDGLAVAAAEALGCALIEFYPDYDRYGRRAPLMRNLEIINKADRVVAFWDMQSTGTRYVIEQCIKMRKPVNVVPISQKASEINIRINNT